MLNPVVINKADVCADCYTITCLGCGWKPNGGEVELIQKDILKNCPDCGWSPKLAV